MSVDDRYLLGELIEQQRAKNHPKLSRDKYFERFSAEQFLKSKGYDLTPEQITSGIIGGGGDGGVDSFYMFINRKLDRLDIDLTKLAPHTLEIELICVQSKNTSSFEESVFIKFEDFVNKCLRINANLRDTQSLYSEGLLDAVGRFHLIYKAALENRPKLSITFCYASLGAIVDVKVQTRRDLFKQLLEERFSNATHDAELVGAKQLFTWSYKSPTTTLTLNTTTHLKWTQKGKGYVCISGLRKFCDFITENGVPREHIFESNVRDHERDATVNKAIRKTLLGGQNTQEFWWLNNGITIVAAKVIQDGDDFLLTDPLIVNGLQTSYEIANHFQQMKLEDDARTVMVRIIETSEPTTVDEIIKATNSQTKISRNSLHATEEIHRDIEAALKLHDLFYERRKNYYKNRKISEGLIITITEMAQILSAIVLQKPDDSRGRPTTVVDKHYKRLFNKDYPFDLYAKCGKVLKKVEEFLDGLDLQNSQKLNIKFHLAMYVTCMNLKSHAPKRFRIAAIKLSEIDDDLLTESYKEVIALFNKRGGADDKIAKGPLLVEDLKEHLKRKFIPAYAKRFGATSA